jgi:DnaJ-class molecular chaperone
MARVRTEWAASPSLPPDLHGEEGLKREKEGANRGGMFDIFGQQHGGGGKRKGPDYRLDFAVTLEDLYNGASRTLKIQRKVLCKSCKGSGAKGGKTTTCPKCNGKGQVMTLQQLGPGFNIQMQTPCEHWSDTAASERVEILEWHSHARAL